MDNIRFYRVGGCVRDKILGVKPKDIDYAVEAPSYAAMRDYIAAHGKIWQEREQFFTIRAQIDGENCDYVLCRKEGFYSDGRRPDSVEVGTIYDDLARRDFTCNAMAMDKDGNILDPYDGQRDLACCQLRCVGNPEDRFKEDSLRMIRALRFCITKDLYLDPRISHCLEDNDLCYLLTKLPIERIRDELFRCFTYDTVKTMHILHQYKAIFFAIFAVHKLLLIPTIQHETKG